MGAKGTMLSPSKSAKPATIMNAQTATFAKMFFSAMGRAGKEMGGMGGAWTNGANGTRAGEETGMGGEGGGRERGGEDVCEDE